MSYIKVNSRWTEDSRMNWRSKCEMYINKTSLQNWRLFSWLQQRGVGLQTWLWKISLYTVLHDLIYIEFQKIKIKPINDVRSNNCGYLDGLIPANVYQESFGMSVMCIILFIYL